MKSNILTSFISSGVDRMQINPNDLASIAQAEGFRARSIGETVKFDDIVCYNKTIERVMNWRDYYMDKENKVLEYTRVYTRQTLV